MTPKQVAILLRDIGSRWLGVAIGKRTRVQIECPHIIDGPPANVTTEDKELGTDHRHSIVAPTARPGTIDHDASPLSRYWRAKLWSAGVGFDMRRFDVPRLRR